MKLLVVIVNYGNEQLNYLQRVVAELKSFEKYSVHIVVNSNIPLNISGVDEVNIYQMDDYQLLPLTCRNIIWENRDKFDVFIYTENDHLFLEHHIDKHLEYEKILPKSKISGLIQYEKNETGYYYPAYHADFDWDYKSVQTYGGKIFAHFNNLHQASFILSQKQLIRIGKRINFLELHSDKDYWIVKKYKNFNIKIFNSKYISKNAYSVKCKVNTDIYRYAGLQKLICISEFKENLIHHLPNIYINGEGGRLKLRSDEKKMNYAIMKLLNQKNYDKT